MIGKVQKGRSFKKCISYVMDSEKKPELLYSEGVLETDMKAIINSFYVQSLMRPSLSKSVGHIPLSYAKEDKLRLTNHFMVQLAKEYLKAMKIENTQFIVVKHGNTDHPHCHIVFNRVDNDGETISDKNDHYRNIEVCKQIKDKYNLTYGKGKEQTNIQKLKGAEKVKYEIYKIIIDSLKRSKDWTQFQYLLRQYGVEIQFKYKGQSDEVQGISFKKGTYSFKGSAVDRKFSFVKLNNQLQQSPIRQSINNANSPTQQGASLIGSMVDALGTLSTSQSYGDDYEEEMFKDRIDYEEKRRQQKAKRKRRLGM